MGIGKKILDGLRDFSGKLRRGEPIELTHVCRKCGHRWKSVRWESWCRKCSKGEVRLDR